MKVSAEYRVKWLNKEIDRLQDLLDRVVEDNAAMRACNKDLVELVGTLRVRCERLADDFEREEECVGRAVEDLRELRAENARLRGDVAVLEDELASYTKDRL